MKAAKLKHQLLCVVTPIDDGRSADVVASTLRRSARALDDLFCAHGGVHFATLTILPPGPAGTRDRQHAALALTLAVDAGMQPEATLERLAALDPKTLADIYGVRVPAGADLRAAVTGVLCREADRQKLTGGFVAARDRSVAQIRAEARLARDLRRRAMAMSPWVRSDGRQLAADLAAQTLADPKFSWARQPAAQGPWRAKVTPAWVRLGASSGWLVAIAWCMLALSALALIGWGNRLVVAIFNDWIGIPDDSLTFTAVLGEGGELGRGLRVTAFALLTVNAAVAFFVRRRRLPMFLLEVVLLISVFLVLVIFPGIAMLAVGDLGAPVSTDLKFARAHLVYGTWVVMGLLALAGIVAAAALLAVALVPPQLPERLMWGLAAAFLGIGLLLLHFVLAGLVFLSNRYQWLGKQWYHEPAPWGWQPIDRIAIVVLGFAVVAYVVVRLALAALTFFSTQLGRLNDPPADVAPNRRLHQIAPSITACEADWADRISVMVSVTEIRPGLFRVRAVAVWFFLWMISSLGWRFYSEGKLASVTAIHYAHWHLIDKGRRLLFCSNYDGDFGGYLDQFILTQVPVLNLIWRWTHLVRRPELQLGGPAYNAAATSDVKFPPTRLLVFLGCRREQQFKAYARESMLPFQYHYAAYNFPIGDILRSTRLRDALSAERTPINDALVLRALEV